MDFVFDYFLVVKRSTTERKVTDQFIARRKGIIKTQIDFKSVITSRNPKYPHSIQAVMYLDYELQFNKIHTYFGIYLQIVLANFKLYLYNFINSHATFYFFLIVQKINQSVIIEISHTLTIQQNIYNRLSVINCKEEEYGKIISVTSQINKGGQYPPTSCLSCKPYHMYSEIITRIALDEQFTEKSSFSKSFKQLPQIIIINN